MNAQKSVTEKDNQDEQHHMNHISFFDRQTTLEEPNCLQISERLFFVEDLCFFSLFFMSGSEPVIRRCGFSQYSGEISSSHRCLEVKGTSCSPFGGV